MAAVAGSLFDLHADRIEEVINNNIDVMLPGYDPVWRNTIVTSQGVGPADAIGKDMKILRVFMGGMTGVLEQGAPSNDFALYGDDTDILSEKIYKQNLNQVFPDPLEGPNQNPYRLGIPMRSMLANIAMTLGELTAEANDAFIGQILAPKMEGFARNIVHTLCNYFYVSQNDQYRLCNIAASPAPAQSGTGPYFVTFSPDNSATDRFYVGQRLDLYGADNNRDNTAGPIYVSAVDELTNRVTLVSETDIFTGAAGKYLVYRNSNTDGTPSSGSSAEAEFTGIAGINSWLKGRSGDTVLLGAEAVGGGDDIDVAVHPEHKSAFFDVGSVTLTEHTLRQYLRRFHAAKMKYGYTIDTLIASEGVWLAYAGTKIGREYLDRTGRVASIRNEGLDTDENFGGMRFSFDGRSYTGYTSCYVESGTVYGIKTGGSNWKRYVPADGQINSTFDRVPAFAPFRFVASNLTGTGTNRLPIYDSSASGNLSRATEGAQMPGWLRMQLVPDQFAGLKLLNCAEDTEYMSTTI
jgi:hypothetical protein